MIVTSVEQSRRLLSAGVSHKSADAFYVGKQRFTGNDYELIGEEYLVIKERGTDEWYDYLLKDFGISMNDDEGVYFMPAWSLAALWEVLHNLDKTYEFETNMSAEVFLGVLVNLICMRFENR